MKKKLINKLLLVLLSVVILFATAVYALSDLRSALLYQLSQRRIFVVDHPVRYLPEMISPFLLASYSSPEVKEISQIKENLGQLKQQSENLADLQQKIRTSLVAMLNEEKVANLPDSSLDREHIESMGKFLSEFEKSGHKGFFVLGLAPEESKEPEDPTLNPVDQSVQGFLSLLGRLNLFWIFPARPEFDLVSDSEDVLKEKWVTFLKKHSSLASVTQHNLDLFLERLQIKKISHWGIPLLEVKVASMPIPSIWISQSGAGHWMISNHQSLILQAFANLASQHALQERMIGRSAKHWQWMELEVQRALELSPQVQALALMVLGGLKKLTLTADWKQELIFSLAGEFPDQGSSETARSKLELLLQSTKLPDSGWGSLKDRLKLSTQGKQVRIEFSLNPVEFLDKLKIQNQEQESQLAENLKNLESLERIRAKQKLEVLPLGEQLQRDFALPLVSEKFQMSKPFRPRYLVLGSHCQIADQQTVEFNAKGWSQGLPRRLRWRALGTATVIPAVPILQKSSVQIYEIHAPQLYKQIEVSMASPQKVQGVISAPISVCNNPFQAFMLVAPSKR